MRSLRRGRSPSRQAGRPCELVSLVMAGRLLLLPPCPLLSLRSKSFAIPKIPLVAVAAFDRSCASLAFTGVD